MLATRMVQRSKTQKLVLEREKCETEKLIERLKRGLLEDNNDEMLPLQKIQLTLGFGSTANANSKTTKLDAN
jgi:hypothetical protein